MAELPAANGWQYEPKWDGFRGVVENLGGELSVWSRNGRPLLRYFPELAEVGEALPPDSALDGEIVIQTEGALDFDKLQMRLHPAESRIKKLSAEIPANFVAFDVLLFDGEEVHRRPLEERRARVEALPFPVSPASRDVEEAQTWLERLEVAGFDGVVAKRLGLPYAPGSREAVVKVKHHKTADCILVGVRWKARPTTIATLLLGLKDEKGALRLRWLGVGGSQAARRDRRDRHAAPRRRPRAPLLGAEPMGFRRPRGVGSPS